MTQQHTAIWFDLHSLIDPSIKGGEITYGQEDTEQGHGVLKDNGWRNQVTMYCLQGLVNRTKPRLMYDTNFWNWRPADTTWRNYYAQKKGMVFETLSDPFEVIKHFREFFKGIVICDPEVEQSLYVGCTFAGLKDVLPVFPDWAERMLKLLPDLKVVEDFRGKWSDELTPLDYNIETLMPQCDRAMIYSVDRLWSGMCINTLDLAVARKSFVFRCSTNEKFSEDCARIWKIHELAGPNCGVYGWGEPEDKYCQMASMNSNYIMCTEAPNLSFHCQIKAESTTKFLQKSHLDPKTFQLEEDKYYVAFLTSEGDAMKIHTVFHGGAWHDENRGQVPINWGFQPRMLELAPAMAEFYYQTMTEQDYFFCGCSGAGYTYPNWMPEPELFFKESDIFMEKADLQVMDAWMHFARPVYERYAELSPHTKAFVMPCGPGQVKMTRAGTPVILRYAKLNYFPNEKTPEDLAEAIREAAETNVCKPAFITVFVVPNMNNNKSAQNGFSPSDFCQVRDLLGTQYKVVTLEEMTLAANAFAQKYPERINRAMGKDLQRNIGVNVVQ